MFLAFPSPEAAPADAGECFLAVLVAVPR